MDDEIHNRPKPDYVRVQLAHCRALVAAGRARVQRRTAEGWADERAQQLGLDMAVAEDPSARDRA